MKSKDHSRMVREVKLGIREFRFSVLLVINMVKLIVLNIFIQVLLFTFSSCTQAVLIPLNRQFDNVLGVS